MEEGGQLHDKLSRQRFLFEIPQKYRQEESGAPWYQCTEESVE